MLASEWSPEDLMNHLLDCHAEWQEDRSRYLRGEAHYLAIAELGRELFAALLAPTEPPWIPRCFEVLERALTHGTATTRNLVVVGLFENLQNQNLSRGAADLIESHLGPRSLQAWGDLIEAWSKPGHRTMAALRAAASTP